jgi:hypothetical protein
MLLIYAAENAGPDYGTPEFGELLEAYGAFSKEVQEAGVLVGGEALQDTQTATSVKVRDGKASITDGPFAETKETLGGYYVLDCKDLDEALAYAAKIPSAAYGTIEVRPVMNY